MTIGTETGQSLNELAHGEDLVSSLSAISLDDVLRSYHWLGHEKRGVTELVAIHPAYRPGRENYRWNKERDAFPRVSYAESVSDVTWFVKRYGKTHMVCYGLNPRPEPYRNKANYFRSAKENEIAVAQNILFDFDYQSKQVSKAQVTAFDVFCREARDYFADLGIAAPVKAHSGRGEHFLFAMAPIATKECNDLYRRVHKFHEDFRQDFHKELDHLEMTLDQTSDLRRVVKCYGTSKPGLNLISRFYGNERQEDQGLSTYIQSMIVDQMAYSRHEPLYGASLVAVNEQLPAIVNSILKSDEKLRDLWHGKGKPKASDTSGSGYDWSIARRLMVLGVRDLDVIATALALRPNGSYQNGDKDCGYLRRTIASAMVR